MALLTRELELIIIARDHTQSTTARVYGALTFIGAAITQMGITWAQTLGDMTQEAIDFRNTAALAFTQMFERGDASIDDIEQSMLRVGREVPVPFDELGEAMFDIFSSIDASVPEAEAILRRVGQAAVAGQTNVRSALIPTIATMNAFGLSAADIDFILDQQFTTVQRGILTYDEYVSNVGKVIPATKAAGQTVQTMGATMAFLTRNGLSAAMAGTSAARAFELFADPKTVKNLEDAGIAVRDQHGEFRQIGDVLQDLDSVFGDLTAPERKEAFKELFGQGRIQARRFFDLAIPNWREFQGLVDVFTSEESLGAMQRAYDVMMEQPRQKLDVLKNRWEALRLEIGMRFIPLLEDKLIPLADELLDFWEALSPEDKDLATKILSIATGFTILFGALTTLVGAGKLIASALGTSGFLGTLAALGGPALAIIGVIAAIAAAAWLIWENWDAIKDFFQREIIPRFEDFVEFMRPYVEDFVNFLVDQWEKLKDWTGELWDKIMAFFQDPRFQEFVDMLVEGGAAIWESLKDIVGPAFELVKTIIENVLDNLMAQIEFVVDAIIWIWDNFGEQIIFVVDAIVDSLPHLIEGLGALLEFITAVFQGDWEAAWQAAKDFVANIFEAIVEAWTPVYTALTGWGMQLWKWFTGVWSAVWTAVSEFFEGIWDAVVEFFQGIWNNEIVQFFKDIWAIWWNLIRIGLQTVWELWKAIWEKVSGFFRFIWETISSVVRGVWLGIQGTATRIWKAIAERIKGPIRLLLTILRGWWTSIKNVAESWWNRAKDIALTIWNKIKDNLVNPVRDAYLSIKGWFDKIVGAIKGLWSKATEWVGKIRNVLSKINPASWFSPPITQTVAAGFSTLENVVTGALKGIETDARTRVGIIRDQVDELSRLQERQRVLAAATTGAGTATQQTNNYNIESTSSPTAIADEISWRTRVGGIQ